MSLSPSVNVPRQQRRDLWLEAADSLSDEDKYLIHFPDLFQGNITSAILLATEKQVDQCKKKEWTFSFGGKQIALRHVLENIVKWTQKFQKVVDFAVSMDASGHAALPWACVKFFLELAGHDLRKYGAMLVGMEFVTREIQFYTIFEAVYLKKRTEATEQLSSTLLKAYTKLLHYLATAKKYFGQHTLTRAIQSPFSEDGVTSLITETEKARILIEQNARLIDKQDLDEGMESLSQGQEELRKELSAWKEPLDSIATQVAEISDTTKRSLVIAEDTKATVGNISADTGRILSILMDRTDTDVLVTIRKYLELPSPKEIRRDYEKRASQLVPGTATWILHEDAFIGWRKIAKPVLSLRGSPGCGKSYLSTMVINHLFQSYDSDGKLVVGYYYFQDNDRRKQSVLNALCTMIYQVAEQNELFSKHAARTCQQSPNFSIATISSIWDDFIASEFGPQSGTQLFLVFDGIDEAVRGDIQQLIDLLMESLKAGSKIQVLLVGRPEMESFASYLDQFSIGTIEISSKANAEDISRFIDYKYDGYLSKHKVRGLREFVTASLRKKAGGMFLWVDLVYQELEKIKTAKTLKQHLENLPSSLTGLYEKIFSRIESNASGSKQLGQLKELFCCLTNFEEPPNVLTLNQLIQFASCDSSFDVESMIADTCASLVSYEETGQMLFEKIMKSESSLQPTPLADVDEDEAFDMESLEDDEDEEFLDEDEAELEELERQREINVKLCHASVGDYLKRQDLKSSAVLFSSKDAAFHIVDMSFKIICEGPAVPERLWLHAMTSIWNRLGDLSEKDVSREQTQIIVQRIWEIFNSQPLVKYIAQHHGTEEGYPLHDECFFFGLNTGKESGNRKTILKWLKKAHSECLTQLDEKIRTWANKTLDAPNTLLVPLAETCMQEWLSSNEDSFILYWRYRFAWQCVVSTDLIPPLPSVADDLKFLPNYPDFVDGNPLGFLAGIATAERSVEVHSRIAKSMAYCGDRDHAEEEYNKAIALAEKEGAEERLKELYFESALSLSDIRLLDCQPIVLQLAEKYLALDPSNFKMHACLGVARLNHLQDSQGAIDAFNSALALEPRDHMLVKALIIVYFSIKNYEGIMELFENDKEALVSSRIRSCIDEDTLQEHIFFAARETDKIEFLTRLYENEISKTWKGSIAGSDEKFGNDSLWDIGFSDRFNTRRYYSWGNALLLCWLALFYRKYQGRTQLALSRWITAFFKGTDLFKLSKASSLYATDIIPMFFAQFAELLHEEALRPDGSVDENMVKLLQQLRQRHDAFQEQDKVEAALTNGKDINLLLARLYSRCGRAEEAQKLLDEQYRRGIEILKDDVEWNDGVGYRILSKNLFTSGRKREAAIALSIKRFETFVKDEEKENSTGREPKPLPPGVEPAPSACESEENADKPRPVVERYTPGVSGCSNSLDCPNYNDHSPGSKMYTCMTCLDVNFCEACYKLLVADERVPGKSLYICSKDHEHLKSPMDDWMIKDNVMTINGKEIGVMSWLSSL